MVKQEQGSMIKFREDRERVVLLVHCFRAGPRIMGELAEELYEAGFSVYNLRLPGHGLVDSKGIYNIKGGQWEFYLENIFLDLAANFEQVYLCGLSLGATLLYNLSVKYHQRISKVALLSPFFRARQKRAAFIGLACLFIKRLRSRRVDSVEGEELFNDFIPFFPLCQGHLAIKAAGRARRNFKHKSPPVLVILSTEDRDMDYETHRRLIEEQTNFELVALEETGHQLTLDRQREEVNAQVLEWFRINALAPVEKN